MFSVPLGDEMAPIHTKAPTPTPDESAAALNAELVDGKPEIVVAKNRK